MTTLALFPADTAAIDSDDAQCTPRDLALELGPFDLDPCSNPRSHIAAQATYSLEAGQDGLALPWNGSVFVNGPYSDPLPWCERLRAYDDQWVALWKLDPTTEWFAVLCRSGAAWAPFKKRLRFERPGNASAANFASVLFWKHRHLSEKLRARLWTPRCEL